MKSYYFIAQKIDRQHKKGFSFIVTRIAIINIALGLAIILASFGIMLGFQKNIQDKLFSMSGHITVTKRANELNEESSLSLNTQLYKNYKNIPSIRHLQAVALKAGILKNKEEVLGVVLKGVDKNFDQNIFEDNIISGKFPSFPEKGYSNDILISKIIAQKLNLGLNDSIIMFFVQDPPKFRKLHIAGIYNIGMEEFDEKFILGDLNLIRRLNLWPDSLAGAYEIFVNDFRRLEQEAIPEVIEQMDFDMWLETITQSRMDIFDWLGLVGKNVNVLLSLILIVAGFNMVSILLIMIMERVQMIGLLKALGATDWQIQQIFIYKGIHLILRGMGIGNLIGLGFCAFQYYFQVIPLDSENYYMDRVPIAWDWFLILGLNLLTIIIIGLILIIPTLIINRIRPVQALRFD